MSFAMNLGPVTQFDFVQPFFSLDETAKLIGIPLPSSTYICTQIAHQIILHRTTTSPQFSWDNPLLQVRTAARLSSPWNPWLPDFGRWSGSLNSVPASYALPAMGPMGCGRHGPNLGSVPQKSGYEIGSITNSHPPKWIYIYIYHVIMSTSDSWLLIAYVSKI